MIVASNCVLCGREAARVAMFVPIDPTAFGVGKPPPGKSRVCYYGLCAGHDLTKPRTQRRLERELRALWSGQLTYNN